MLANTRPAELIIYFMIRLDKTHLQGTVLTCIFHTQLFINCTVKTKEHRMLATQCVLHGVCQHTRHTWHQCIVDTAWRKTSNRNKQDVCSTHSEIARAVNWNVTVYILTSVTVDHCGGAKWTLQMFLSPGRFLLWAKGRRQRQKGFVGRC